MSCRILSQGSTDHPDGAYKMDEGKPSAYAELIADVDLEWFTFAFINIRYTFIVIDVNLLLSLV